MAAGGCALAPVVGSFIGIFPDQKPPALFYVLLRRPNPLGKPVNFHPPLVAVPDFESLPFCIRLLFGPFVHPLARMAGFGVLQWLLPQCSFMVHPRGLLPDVLVTMDFCGESFPVAV